MVEWRSNANDWD